MSVNVIYLVIGFIIGCAVLGTVWAIVAISQKAGARRNTRRRTMTITSIGRLCAQIDNAFSEFKLGQVGVDALKETIRPRLEEINAQLKTNMDSMDPYYVKYIEKFIEDEWAALLALTKGAVSDVASPAQDKSGAGEVAAVDGRPSGDRQMELFEGEAAKLTPEVPAAGGSGAASAAISEAAVEEKPLEAAAEKEIGTIAPPPPPPAIEPQASAPEIEIGAAVAGQAQEEGQGVSLGSEIAQVRQAESKSMEDMIKHEETTPSVESEVEDKWRSRSIAAESPPDVSSWEGQDHADIATQPAYESQVEDADEMPVVNRFIPIEQSGLIEDEIATARRCDADASKVIEQPPVPQADVERSGISDTLVVAGDEGQAKPQIEQTQFFDRGALAEAIEQEAKSGLGLDEQPQMLTPEDESAGGSFIFSGNEQPAQAAVAPYGGPAAEPPPTPTAEQGMATAEEEEVFEVGGHKDEEGEPDALITGDDVLKKLDNFFGFN